MYDEKDHSRDGMSFAARAAWVMVIIVFMFVFLPALTMSTTPPEHKATETYKTYQGPLDCYESDDGAGNTVLVCKPPYDPGPYGK